MGIIVYIISLFILYLVIETAVRRGINSSKIGQLIEDKYEKEEKLSFFDNDLDD
ncbi:hypothetical protein [Aquibacillus saliphilus]|uniref:hypothetical protein n=1 Tax=Aquibacillus saliphilus TaxID=1909422 RepID=UPI001CF0569C|nr:hypothetical protein [Aquibacillus saliphilus]